VPYSNRPHLAAPSAAPPRSPHWDAHGKRATVDSAVVNPLPAKIIHHTLALSRHPVSFILTLRHREGRWTIKPVRWAIAGASPVLSHAIRSWPASDILTISFPVHWLKQKHTAPNDLDAWTNPASAFTATNNTWASASYWNVRTIDRLFFRLQLLP